MDVLEYFKIKKRMTNKCEMKCDECPLYDKSNNKQLGCKRFEMLYPNEAIKIIEEWSKKHPLITNADKYKEVIKETFRDDLIDVCDKQVPNFKCSSFASCDECIEFWNSEYTGKEIKNNG